MKYFSFTLIGIAILLIGYNSTFLDFKNLFNDDSGVALIGIITAVCAILLVLILRISKTIEKKKNY